MKETTMRDVAAKANTSVSTVSRALNNDLFIREETRKRVQEVARSMGYIPNPAAQFLRSKRSKLIGVILPDMVDSFFYHIYQALQVRLSKEGWVTLVTFSEESVEKERELLAALVTHKVSGIVMSVCHSSKNNELYQSIIDGGIPIVFFDRVPTRMRASSVNIDNEGAVFELTEHLIQSGYKNIVHVAGPPHLPPSRPRRKGYEEAMKKYKMPVQTYSCGNLDIDSGAAVAVDLIEDLDKIDAVVTCDDMIAIGLVHELQRRGFRIPSDVAVSGIGGSVMNTVVFPEITTIEFPMPEMGSCAADLVMSMIREVEKEKERERKEKERMEKEGGAETGKKIGVVVRKKIKTKTIILKPTTRYRASTEKDSGEGVEV